MQSTRGNSIEITGYQLGLDTKWLSVVFVVLFLWLSDHVIVNLALHYENRGKRSEVTETVEKEQLRKTAKIQQYKYASSLQGISTFCIFHYYIDI